MAKPTTTLADDLLFDKSRTIIDDRTNSRAKQLLRTAQRFVLTEDAAIRVGEAIRNYPEMLVEHGVFARTPFPTCWIEFPSPGFHEAIVPGSSTSEADVRVGYLFHGDDVYVAAQTADYKGAQLSPMVYHLHHPLTLPEELRLADRCGISRGQLDNFYWGATMASGLPQSTLRGLRAQHGVSLAIDPRYSERIKAMDFLGFSAGEVRNIIGLLLMLNQPSGVLDYADVPLRRTMSHRGTRVLMSHSVITINLDKRSRPDRILRPPRSTHASPKWHNVMNHWCNDRVSRARGYSVDDAKTHGRGDHAHQWVQDESGELRFTCSICDGRRWRREMKNGRGDRSRGVVSQERIIGTSRDVEREYA